MDPKLVALLRKQKYQLIGNHAATKMCTWARKAIKGQGSCYKQKFYGIASHRCIQMTPCADCCTHRCSFCWRAVEFTQPFMKDPDEPKTILDQLVKSQQLMVNGYRGYTHDAEKLKEAHDPKHIAISLSGEPLMYPYLDELINLSHKRGFTTFVVTNGTQPKALESMKHLPTQLYVTLPAPDEKTYLKTCNPVKNHWAQILETLDLLPSLKTRTAIRLTLVKGLNLKDAHGYAGLIQKALPWFVEPKAYMHLGFSTNRLPGDAMPEFAEIDAFAKELSQQLEYEYNDQQEISRVCLLARDEAVIKDKQIGRC